MQKIETKTFVIRGMTCIHCQNTIEKALQSQKGVKSAKVRFSSSLATIAFDPGIIRFSTIKSIIEKLDYKVVSDSTSAKAGKKETLLRFIGVIVALFIVYQIIRMAGGLNFFNAFPQAEQGMGYGVLFLLGILTSIHCIAMCGGINLSQCVPNAADSCEGAEKIADRNLVKKSIRNSDVVPKRNLSILENPNPSALSIPNPEKSSVPDSSEPSALNPSKQTASGSSKPSGQTALRPSLLYNAGRVISYTVIGGIVGGIGSVISFPGMAKGVVAILAGILMVVMGINMLSLFPSLRRFNIRMPRVFTRSIDREKQSNRPFYVGLLNGLMPCGPLQAMQLYALSTGSPWKGALSMFFFSLGTVPLMFGLGAFSSLMSRKFTSKIKMVSAALVVILGVAMFHNGMSLSGFAIPSFSNQKPASAALVNSSSGGTDSSGGANASNGSGSSPTAGTENIQLVNTTLAGGNYSPITVKSGIPVKWTISAKAGDITGCNSTLLIPKYNIKKKLVPGDNIIEFTPSGSGTVPYSCWMGMITSTITVQK